MRLSQYLGPDLVLTDLVADNVHTVVEAVADHLAGTGVIPDRDAVAVALAAREATHTTALGDGVALPHATIRGIEQPILLVATARRPIQFGPEGTDPVQLFFVLLSPPGHDAEHIKLLARICRLARHPGFVTELITVPDGDGALALIRRIDELHV